MKVYRVYQVDSFTTKRFYGNPAGVVVNADGLSDGQMQSIARELNNSETAFILSPKDKKADVRVRFFTPTNEVPICGHATIAAHYVRALEFGLDKANVWQETGAGILEVEINKSENSYFITMTQGAVQISNPLSSDIINKLIKALNITLDDLRSDCPICIASTGHSKVMIGIKSKELLDSLKPNQDLLISISKEIGCNGYYVFALNEGFDVLVYGRMFAPAIGINEDPVTGNANGPLGAYLVHFNLFQNNEDEFKFRAVQGEAMGRPGSMEVVVKKEDNRPKMVQIIGQAVIAFKTEILI